MAAPTISLLVREVGGFWALCREGRRYRVTAYRVTKRSPSGRGFQAYTRLSLSDGVEVRRIRDEVYRADRLGILFRAGWGRPMA